MLAGENGVKTLCVLPEGAVALDVVEVCGYLRADGARQLALRCTTDAPLSTVIGLLRLGEHEILRRSDDWPATQEEGGSGDWRG